MERRIMVPYFTDEDLEMAANAATQLGMAISFQALGNDLYAVGAPADLEMLFNFCAMIA